MSGGPAYAAAPAAPVPFTPITAQPIFQPGALTTDPNVQTAQQAQQLKAAQAENTANALAASTAAAAALKASNDAAAAEVAQNKANDARDSVITPTSQSESYAPGTAPGTVGSLSSSAGGTGLLSPAGEVNLAQQHQNPTPAATPPQIETPFTTDPLTITPSFVNPIDLTPSTETPPIIVAGILPTPTPTPTVQPTPTDNVQPDPNTPPLFSELPNPSPPQTQTEQAPPPATVEDKSSTVIAGPSPSDTVTTTGISNGLDVPSTPTFTTGSDTPIMSVDYSPTPFFSPGTNSSPLTTIANGITDTVKEVSGMVVGSNSTTFTNGNDPSLNAAPAPDKANTGTSTNTPDNIVGSVTTFNPNTGSSSTDNLGQYTGYPVSTKQDVASVAKAGVLVGLAGMRGLGRAISPTPNDIGLQVGLSASGVKEIAMTAGLFTAKSLGRVMLDAANGVGIGPANGPAAEAATMIQDGMVNQQTDPVPVGTQFGVDPIPTHGGSMFHGGHHG